MRVGIFILMIALLISAFGLLSIYSSTYDSQAQGISQVCKRQMLWIILGVILFMLMSNFNYRRLWDVSYFLYALAVFLLFLVFILGAIRMGAQRWLKFAWFTFQPSEVAKLAVIIFLAKYFSRKSTDDIGLRVHKLGILRGIIMPFLFIAIPTGLIIEQPDLGSGLILLFIFMAMLFIGGVRLKYIIMILSLGLLVAPCLWHFLRDYQKERLLVFLNPDIDPLGAGYTIIQSKIAIGSGGFFGKGFLGGTQSQLHFLPESHTDFIFATFAEEWGLMGGAALLLLYFLLAFNGLRIALRTNDYFGRLLALGISFSLAVQVFINIAMNLGLAPVVGIPLPLMSYGGSCVLITFISLGILVNIDKSRAVF